MSSTSEFVLKWGIVSTGSIAQDFVTAVQSLSSPFHVMQAVGARRLDDAQKFATRFGMPAAYGSYDELVNDPNINIVYVGSVNPTHKDVCVKALNAGKHVLCEKPMTMNSKQQEEVFAAAKKNNKFFMEAIWTRFFPVMDKIRQEIDNGAIGELKYLSSYFLLPVKDMERVKNKALGGGTVLDIGVYPIQMALHWFNHEKPLKVTVSGHLMENGVDECCTIVLLFSNNRIATINVSSNCAQFASTNLVGDKGVITIPDWSWCPVECTVNGVKHTFPLPECGPTNYFHCVGLRWQAEAARESISKGDLDHPLVKHDHSRLIMSIIDEANKQLGHVYPFEH